MKFGEILCRCMVEGVLNTNLLLNEANKQKFKFKYEDTGYGINRVIFYLEYRPILLEDKMFCNGLIYEYIANDWVLVCLPLPVFEEGYKISDITSDFVAYPIHDATIVNIYYSQLDEGWTFSTKRSINIMPQTWRGVAYSDILEPLMNSINLKDLDTSMTYVYTVTDPRVHIFSREASYNHIATLSLESCELYNGIEFSADEAVSQIENAYSRYIENSEVMLGYIYRNGQHSYIIESDLLKTIRKILYRPTIEYNAQRKRNVELLNLTNNIEYIKCRAYFNYYTEACALFPSFIETFDKYPLKISRLASYLKARISRQKITVPNEQFELIYASKISTLSLLENLPPSCLFDAVVKFIFENKKISEIFF